jgi:hypothetical protein
MCVYVFEAFENRPGPIAFDNQPVPVEECIPEEYEFDPIDVDFGVPAGRNLQSASGEEYTECVPPQYVQEILELGLAECGVCDTAAPSLQPTTTPSFQPTLVPSTPPTSFPSSVPSVITPSPTMIPTNNPTLAPSFGFQCPGEICYDAPDDDEEDYVFVCIGGLYTYCVSQEEAQLLLLDPTNFCGRCPEFNCPPDSTCGGNKILLCHYAGGGQNSEICIPPSSFPTHKGDDHCDYCGECLPEPPPDKCEAQGGPQNPE